MTRKEKMEFKRQVRAIFEHTFNDVYRELHWAEPGVRRTHVDMTEYHQYRDKRFDKAANQVSDLAKKYAEANTDSSNPPSGHKLKEKD